MGIRRGKVEIRGGWGSAQDDIDRRDEMEIITSNTCYSGRWYGGEKG
jgi:hypothetical protein